jgi:hypothetical protein
MKIISGDSSESNAGFGGQSGKLLIYLGKTDFEQRGFAGVSHHEN